MKIKSCYPTIFSDHINETIAEWEKFGLKKIHHLYEEFKLDLYVMEAEDGSRVDVVCPPDGKVKFSNGFRIDVDDLDEAIKYLSAYGFKPLYDVMTVGKTKLIVMVWEKANLPFCVIEHIKD